MGEFDAGDEKEANGTVRHASDHHAHREGEGGEVVVRCKTFDQLEFLCRRLRGD